MSRYFALSIGESFAELLGFTADAASSTRAQVKSRWYLSKRNLGDGLVDAFRELGGTGPGQLLVASRAVDRILAQGQGRPPTVLVSSGFEHSLSLLNAEISPPFSFRPRRSDQLQIDPDAVFSVSERIGSDGRIHTPLTASDLEPIAARLAATGSQDLVVLFMNAIAHYEHELEAMAFFTKLGIRVFPSHQIASNRASNQMSEDDAVAIAIAHEHRWREAIESAFSASAVAEEKASIEMALNSAGANDWTLRVWTHDGIEDWSSYRADRIRGGFRKALTTWADRSKSASSSAGSSVGIHCGLDEFGFFGGSALRAVHPTQAVGRADWGFPHFTENIVGLTPGPMLFGRSQQLAALDVLYAANSLKEIEGLTPLISEKSKNRILEALLSLAKSSTAGKRPPEPIEVARALEKNFVEILAAQLAILLSKPKANHVVTKEVKLTGPLSTTFAPLLRERRPDLRILVEPEAEWLESRAVAVGYDVDEDLT